MIQKIILLIIISLILKIIYNFYYFLLAKWYYKKYKKFIKGEKSWFIKEHKQRIIKLLEKAGIEDAFQPSTEPTGFGIVATSTFSVFKNLTVTREDIVVIINGDFKEAIGVYKQRIYESANPFYWFEFVFYLPKHLFNFIGVKPDALIIKVAQILYWFIGFISGLLNLLKK